MLKVFLLQWQRLMKRPVLIFTFTALTVIFVLIMGGAQLYSSVHVPVYSNNLDNAALESNILELDEDPAITFEMTDEETAIEAIRMNRSSFALELNEDNYRFIVGREDEEFSLVSSMVSQSYRESARLNEVRTAFPDATVEVNDYIQVEKRSLSDSQADLDAYQLFVLVAMTLYFVMYTIFFMQTNLMEEKQTGTWDRLITSPLSKVDLYMGHLLYNFTLGIMQIAASFFILTQFLNINFGPNLWQIILIILAFLFTTISLGILLISLAPTIASLNAIVPLVTTASAMIGGAFWNLEIVTNDIMLALAELMPIKHALYGAMDVFLNQATRGDLLQVIGILVLMGVLFMGIGINLMERSSGRPF